jgi:hypothetical protein
MRPPKLELPLSKCDASTHFMLMSCHNTLEVVHERIITVYIYPVENSKYTQMRLILTNAVIKNILIILHVIVLLVCFVVFVVSVFQNMQTLPNLQLGDLTNECRWVGIKKYSSRLRLQGLIGDGALAVRIFIFLDSTDINSEIEHRVGLFLVPCHKMSQMRRRCGWAPQLVAFPRCGIEMRNQMQRDASTLNLPINKCISWPRQ